MYAHLHSLVTILRVCKYGTVQTAHQGKPQSHLDDIIGELGFQQTVMESSLQPPINTFTRR